MKKSQIIEIGEMVRTACQRPENFFGPEIWDHHIVDVVDYARRLARELHADEEVVELAALLHDYASVKDHSLYPEHHLHGARMAGEILSGYGYPAEKIVSVKRCIESHRASILSDRNTAEQKILASADAMSHFNNIPSLMLLAQNRHQLDRNAGIAWVKAKLEASLRKMIPEGRKHIRHKIEALQSLGESSSATSVADDLRY
jgi:uncharacterized protein